MDALYIIIPICGALIYALVFYLSIRALQIDVPVALTHSYKYFYDSPDYPFKPFKFQKVRIKKRDTSIDGGLFDWKDKRYVIAVAGGFLLEDRNIYNGDALIIERTSYNQTRPNDILLIKNDIGGYELIEKKSILKDPDVLWLERLKVIGVVRYRITRDIL